MFWVEVQHLAEDQALGGWVGGWMKRRREEEKSKRRGRWMGGWVDGWPTYLQSLLIQSFFLKLKGEEGIGARLVVFVVERLHKGVG